MRNLTACLLAPSIVVAAAATAHAQIASDDFESGNPNLWGVEFVIPGTQMPTGGNPGGKLAVTIANSASSLPAAMIVPAAPGHPYSGNFRAFGVSEFRFDRQVEAGAANFGTLPFLVLGNDGGTPNNLSDDAWLFTPTGDNFQFGFVPYATITTPIPSNELLLPSTWDVQAFPSHPLAQMGATTDDIWNSVIEDVSYVGIAMNRPWNGGAWFGQHILSLDNFALDMGPNIGINYCGPAVLNSSGQSGEIRAQGTTIVAQNSFELSAQSLPANIFGFFIASPMQGFVMNPGGSAGNLCLAGSIGRYVGPGEIQNSGLGGSISLALDLNNVPTPNGFVPMVPGGAWNFQLWHRDGSPAGPTSNFTNGLSVTFQ
jgi:hypothetical protein